MVVQLPWTNPSQVLCLWPCPKVVRRTRGSTYPRKGTRQQQPWWVLVRCFQPSPINDQPISTLMNDAFYIIWNPCCLGVVRSLAAFLSWGLSCLVEIVIKCMVSGRWVRHLLSKTWQFRRAPSDSHMMPFCKGKQDNFVEDTQCTTVYQPLNIRTSTTKHDIIDIE